MRATMAVIGIALLAIILSIIVAPRGKNLTPNIQEREDERRKDEYKPNAPAPTGPAGIPVPDKFEPPMEGAVNAVISIKDRGDIGIQMYPMAAPKTVARMVELFGGGFYNGIKIHRVESGFVVQAGDPETKSKGVDTPGIGTHGSGKNIPFEKNKLPHVAGSIAMALNSPASDTADSQWFINLSNNHALDGQYCVFGKVNSGIDKLGQIKKGDVIEKITVAGK